MVTFKSPSELRRIREAGQIVARTLERVAGAARPGVSLEELDALAAACIEDAGARPSFLHYRPPRAPVPYPAVLLPVGQRRHRARHPGPADAQGR